jgi:hypothetical protein
MIFQNSMGPRKSRFDILNDTTQDGLAFIGIIMLFLGTLFINFYLHGLQKLNCYNHVFLSYLKILESK